MVEPRDTSGPARRRQVEALRAMRPEDRLRIALEMSEEIRALAASGIRARHPDYGERDVGDALEDLLLGPTLAAAARRSRLLATR